MAPAPLFDADEPIACTLTNDEMAPRADLLDHLRRGTKGFERTADGVRARFDGSAERRAELEAFVAAESSCCRFWGFVIEAGDEAVLRWEGPPGTERFFDVLIDYFGHRAEAQELLDAVGGPQPVQLGKRPATDA